MYFNFEQDIRKTWAGYDTMQHKKQEEKGFLTHQDSSDMIPLAFLPKNIQLSTKRAKDNT